MASTFPDTLDTFGVPPSAGSKRASPSLAGNVVSFQDALTAIEDWLIEEVYTPATAAEGDYYVIQGTGHPAWVTQDRLPMLNPDVSQQDGDGTNGGKITLSGSGAAAKDWHLQALTSDLVLTKNATRAFVFSAGQIQIDDVAGVSIIRMDTDTNYMSITASAAEELVLGNNGVDLFKVLVGTTSSAQIKLGGSWYDVPFGAGRISNGTAAASGGNDGDIYLRYEA